MCKANGEKVYSNSARNLIVTNAAGDVIAEYPDFEPGQLVAVGPAADGSNLTDATAGWAFVGPTRHPRTAVIRDLTFGITVHVERVRLAVAR